MITTVDHDGVAEVQLAHGAVNALDLELLRAIPPALAEVADAKGVVLTGAGKCFSAGVDLKRIVDGGPDYVAEFLPALGAAALALFEHPRPLVAAVHGHALAGGCVFACACDLRLMSGGTIGMTEMTVGAPFPAVPLEIVRHAVGAASSGIVFSARQFDPETALRVGLVDEVLAADELLPAAIQRVEQLSVVLPEVYALTKRQLREPAMQRIEVGQRRDDPEVIRLWGAEHVRERFAGFLSSLASR